MRHAILVALSLSLPMTVHAACPAPESRQFDFWVGDWDVVAPAGHPTPGKALGHNRIEKVSAGCGLLENWTGASGVEGKSINGWDAVHQTWRQLWVGGDGTVLELAGGLQGQDMVLRGELPSAKGGVQQQRITYSPLPGGGLTQHWETSDDGGATWATSFLGEYRRAAAK